MSASNRAVAVVAIAVALGLPACTGKKAQAPTSPGAAGADAPGHDPLAELDRLEQRMIELELPVRRGERGAASAAAQRADANLEADMAGGETEALAVEESMRDEAGATAPAAEEPRRRNEKQTSQCQDICELNVAICDLEQQICSLSDAHGGDPTYADACERASEDCEVANLACDRCDA